MRVVWCKCWWVEYRVYCSSSAIESRMAFQDNSYRSENTSDECSTLMPTTATTTISRQPPKMVQRRYFILVLFTLASGLFLFKSWTQFGSTDVKLVRFDRTAESTTNRIYSHHHNNNNDNSQHSSLLLPMPSGVNFGSWLPDLALPWKFRRTLVVRKVRACHRCTLVRQDLDGSRKQTCCEC
jgi:hypothetical protein